jgi:hypothetical protein
MEALVVIALLAVVLAALWIVIARRPRLSASPLPVSDEEARGLDPRDIPGAMRPDFAEPAVARILAITTGDAAARRDPVRLLEDAVLAAAEVGTPSKLVLQRKLGLTFEQAGDLVHRMEELGLVARTGSQKQAKLLPEAYAFAREIADRRTKSLEPNGEKER